MVGTAAELSRPAAHPDRPASTLLLASLSQGLVRLDAQGQVEAGLAIRWDVSDDGLYYTFRIADGAPIDADDAARLLRTATARGGSAPLKPLLDAVDEIVAVTPEVVEIRLSAPRPDLLVLLAHPAFALAPGGSGSGPYRIASRSGGTAILAFRAAAEDGSAARRPVRLHVERAARAVARFAAGQVDAVLGGTFADLPIARAAGIAPPRLRLDPVNGLFGLQVLRERGPLATAADRARVFAAVDRARIAGEPAAAAPPMAGEPIEGELRVALPDGPGATRLFRLLAADWSRLGLGVTRVGPDEDADLRLIDEVAPTDATDWGTARLGCAAMRPCSAEADDALQAAREAAEPQARAAALARAAEAQRAAALFLPLGRPTRWALTAEGVSGWAENGRAAHPLDSLSRR